MLSDQFTQTQQFNFIQKIIDCFKDLFAMYKSQIANDNPTDLSDLAEQRKILFALIGNMQKTESQQKTQIRYDPVLRISQLFKVDNQPPQIIKKQEKKQEKGILFSVKKFITSCTCLSKSDKAGEKSLRQILFDALKCEQFDWLERHYKRFEPEQLGEIEPQYINRMNNALSKIRFEVEQDRVDQKTREDSLNCIKKLQKIYDDIKPTTKSKFKLFLKWKKDYVLTIMISAFHVFQQNYNSYKRTKLKTLFKQLSKQVPSFNNSIQVLRFLQNKDPFLAQLKPITQLDLNSQVAKCINAYMKDNKLQQLRTTIALVKVSQNTKRRRVINLLISGFLSEDVDKKQQWNQLLACMPDSEVYGLQWESNTINRLIKFLALSIRDIILGKDLNELFTKDNPFIPAFQVSVQAGQMLAYVVHKIFPFQFINIISYSLGSELIRAFVQKTIELNGGVNINKVITLGGVSDVNEYRSTFSKTQHSINILNIRTKHDSVLKYILKKAKPNVVPLGLTDIQNTLGNHVVQNLDVSKQIKGHFSFMTNFGTIAQKIMLNQQ